MARRIDKTAVLNKVALFWARFHDLSLALWVMLIITFLIIPVPPTVVDGLVAINMTVAIILLMLSLYVPSIISLSTFPTLLLFTTLFRLSLNITTTRQILLHADAGQIIFTFGHFVVGGNYIVGGVVFLIITIVQFVVIAKGAERVAEVSARFALDAMPGKQMSIDGDLRANTIDQNEARRRRQSLEDESKLYGAMDGAMKFIKGEAIAGLIITVINIIGGFCIGSFQKGLPMTTAIQKYTILTIGDGLVSQIPALLICITSGIIVTRVDATEGSGHLAGEIIRQIAAKPRALMVGGCILALQMLVPGFPKLHFFLISMLTIGIGFLLTLAAKRRTSESWESQIEPGLLLPANTQIPKRISLSIPLTVEISTTESDLFSLAKLEGRFEAIGHEFYLQTGVPFPGATPRFASQLPEATYQVLIFDVPLYSGRLFRDKLLVPGSTDKLNELQIEATMVDAIPGMKTACVKDDYRTRLQAENLTFWDAGGTIANHLSIVLHKHAVEFIDLFEVRHLVDQAKDHYEPLVLEVQKTLPLQTIVTILKYLVEEYVSIRNIKLILESIVEHGGKEKNPLQLAEYARQKLKRQIVHQYCDKQGTLNVVLLHPELETRLQESLRQTPEGIFISAPNNVIQSLIDKIAAEAKNASLQKLAIVTLPEIRHHIRKLIERTLPEVPVLAHNELTPEIKLKPLANIKA